MKEKCKHCDRVLEATNEAHMAAIMQQHVHFKHDVSDEASQ